MREVHHLTLASVRRVPWKNGRGTTEELAVWPADSSFERGDFDWRISKAAVVEPGPFSSFPGFDRILVVTSGEGLVLSHGDVAPRARLRRFEPYRFSGEWPTKAELPSGPVTDFNVLVRRERCEADVQVSQLGARRSRESVGREQLFVHAFAGGLVARVPGEEEAFHLRQGESLWALGLGPDEEVDLRGESTESVVILVRAGAAEPD